MWHPGPKLWALHLWPLDESSRTSPRAFKTQSLRLEPRLQDASTPSNGLSSPPGAQPVVQPRAGRYIEHDIYAHLVSKAGS